MSDDLRMDAYYYGFDPTGERTVDLVLSAVACAGKAYHHTESWRDETWEWKPLRGTSPVEWIQNAANDAAAELARLRTLLAAKDAALRQVMNVLTVPAAEYVPAIPDAIAVCQRALGEGE